MEKYKESSNKHCTKSIFYAMSESRGITLIVLIITIVVLLILAGVAVAHITGGEGIIEQASERRDEATIANEKNILGNVVIEATNKFGDITEENLRTALSKYNVEITPSGGIYKIVFKDSNNLYKMNHDGEFLYWEDMAPTDIYAKKAGTTLYLRSTQPDTSYVKGTQWNDAEITKVVIEEPIAPTTCYEMFKDCSLLEKIDNIEKLHTENTTSMESMFNGCQSLKSIELSYFDTSKVENMAYLFHNCVSLIKINVGNFNTSKVTTMEGMFSGSSTQKKDLNTFYDYRMNLLEIIGLDFWDTKNVTNMKKMFQMCVNLTSINLSSFNTEKVTDMSLMFGGCAWDIDIRMKVKEIIGLENLQTPNLITMNQMFYECSFIKELNLLNFDTRKVTNMELLFYGCLNLKTIYIGNNFDTSIVSSSNNMFRYCNVIVGGNGTKYASSNPTDKTYARLDGGPNSSTPGYFTLKEN